MRRIYFIGLILYTFIVLHVAFPNIFSFEDLETVHVGYLFCSICSRLLYFYMAFEKKRYTR